MRAQDAMMGGGLLPGERKSLDSFLRAELADEKTVTFVGIPLDRMDRHHLVALIKKLERMAFERSAEETKRFLRETRRLLDGVRP